MEKWLHTKETTDTIYVRTVPHPTPKEHKVTQYLRTKRLLRVKENGLFEGRWAGTSSYLHGTKQQSSNNLGLFFWQLKEELYSTAQALPLSDFRSLILNPSLSPLPPMPKHCES